MATGSRLLFRAGLLATFSFLAAVAVYRMVDVALRRHALVDMSDRAERFQQLGDRLGSGEEADKAEHDAILAEMRGLLGETRELFGTLSGPSMLSVLLGLATGVVLLSACFLAFLHSVGLRARVAALMDHAGARAGGLADPLAFRFEKNRLVVTRPLANDSVDDLNDFRLAVARVIDSPGDDLEIDARSIVSPTSQVFGLIAEAALEAREHRKELRVLVSGEFAELAEAVGLDKVVQLSTSAGT